MIETQGTCYLSRCRAALCRAILCRAMSTIRGNKKGHEVLPEWALILLAIALGIDGWGRHPRGYNGTRILGAFDLRCLSYQLILNRFVFQPMEIRDTLETLEILKVYQDIDTVPRQS